jgi:paraquat-inducible protein B
MFDLLRRWSMVCMGVYFDKDGGSGSGGQADDSAKEDAGKETPPPDDASAGDDNQNGKAKKEEKTFTQAELDQKIEERLQHERRKAEQAAAKARKDAEAAALEKNQEWQKLAETRATEIATLSKERDDLAPYKEQAEKYKKALDDQLTTIKAKLPKHLLPLIDKMDPVEAMAYITEHGKEIGVGPQPYSETPEGKERKLSEDDKKSGQRATSDVIARTF